MIIFQQSYRARYESEGCRGPIRGISENGFPTVRVCIVSLLLLYSCAFGLQQYYCSPCATLQIKMVKFFHTLQSFAIFLRMLRSSVFFFELSNLHLLMTFCCFYYTIVNHYCQCCSFPSSEFFILVGHWKL